MPWRVAGLYGLFGLAWILFSDLGLSRLGLDHATELTVQMWKGWAYVLLSAALIYGLLRMVVARLAAQAEALKSSEARYRLLFDDNPHPMWAYDLETLRFVAVNQAGVDCLGYAMVELAGMSARDLLIPDDRPRFDDLLARYRSDGGDSAGRWRVRNRAGDLVYLDLVSHSVVLDGRRAQLLQGKDVTAQVAAETSLVSLSEQLANVSAEMRDIGQAAAHQLQQPLRQVVSHLQLLARRCGDLDGDAREFLTFAIEGALRMKTTLDDIVQLTGMDPEPPEFVPLQRIADEVAAMLQPRLSAAGGCLTVGPLPVLRARGRHMKLLLHHLLDNAIKFRHSARPPDIRIAAEQTGGFWRVRVSDNGIGVPPEHRLDVFGAFRRIHGDPSLPGNGIGLAVCKKIVDQHGGHIELDSQPDQGCTVSFTLPG